MHCFAQSSAVGVWLRRVTERASTLCSPVKLRRTQAVKNPNSSIYSTNDPFTYRLPWLVGIKKPTNTQNYITSGRTPWSHSSLSTVELPLPRAGPFVPSLTLSARLGLPPPKQSIPPSNLNFARPKSEQWLDYVQSDWLQFDVSFWIIQKSVTALPGFAIHKHYRCPKQPSKCRLQT